MELCIYKILGVKDNKCKAPLKFMFLWSFLKLSPVDKFYLKNLVDSIKYLKNSENVKQWLASNNYRLKMRF